MGDEVGMRTCPRCGYDPERFLSVKDAAARLGVTGQTVRNYVKWGELPGTVTEGTRKRDRLGRAGGPGSYLIPVEALDALAERRAKEQAAKDDEREDVGA